MHSNPERVAWIVILSAFVTLCLILVAVPLGIRWRVRNVVDEHKASVESLVGTVVVEPALGQGPVPLSKGQTMDIAEGTTIRVDETSEAVVTFFDHSFMHLFPETTVRLERMISPRYKSGVISNTVQLDLLAGQALVSTALLLDTPLDFRIATLHADAILAPSGSYSVAATNERTEIITHRGEAHISSVSSEDGQIDLRTGERTQVYLGQPPETPTGAARDLLVNGDFSEPISRGWRVFNDQGTDGGEVDGNAELVVDEGQRAARFLRLGGQGNHCETILEQAIDQKLPDPVNSLVVRVRGKVRYQSLSGGGYLNSEYPLMIRLTYRDVYDSEAEWIQGFYYQNADDQSLMYGQQVTRDRWFLFDSDNLLETLPIRPFRIIRLRVYASGWDYESLVSEVNLIVE